MEKSGGKEPENSKEPETAAQPTPMEYFRAARAHLKGGRQKDAYGVLIQAIVHYPHEPVLLSFYGSLQAVVDKKYRSGIESCRKALAAFKPKDAETAATLYPVFYLNLGKAYLASGKKKKRSWPMKRDWAMTRTTASSRRK